MRPLAPARFEFAVFTALWLTFGLVFGVVGVAIARRPAGALFQWLVVGAVYGAFMTLSFTRRYVDQVLDRPQSLESIVVEARRRTLVRLLARVASALMIAVLASFFGEAALMGGISAGMGMTMLYTSRKIADWEASTRCVLLREPRNRWEHDREKRRPGRGLLDPRDFYAAPKPRSAASVFAPG